MEIVVAIFITGTIFSVIGWLLSNKDKKQGEEITKLFALHEADSRELMQLRLEIARNHYPKSELDVRFAQLDATIKEGFKDLGTDIKEMTKALHDHLKEHHERNGQ